MTWRLAMLALALVSNTDTRALVRPSFLTVALGRGVRVLLRERLGPAARCDTVARGADRGARRLGHARPRRVTARRSRRVASVGVGGADVSVGPVAQTIRRTVEQYWPEFERAFRAEWAAAATRLASSAPSAELDEELSRLTGRVDRLTDLLANNGDLA